MREVLFLQIKATSVVKIYGYVMIPERFQTKKKSRKTKQILRLATPTLDGLGPEDVLSSADSPFNSPKHDGRFKWQNPAPSWMTLNSWQEVRMKYRIVRR